MDSYFVDAFCQLRDHAKPISQQDAADLEHIRAPMPPSRKHLKVLARHASGKVFQDPPKVKTPEQMSTRELSDARHAWHKRQIASLGGSRTIAPDPKIERGPIYLNFVDHPTRTECVAPSDPTFAERKRLYRATQVELAKMLYTEHQPSLLDFIEFGE